MNNGDGGSGDDNGVVMMIMIMVLYISNGYCAKHKISIFPNDRLKISFMMLKVQQYGKQHRLLSKLSLGNHKINCDCTK